MKLPQVEDSQWEYLLYTRVFPYIPIIQKLWQNKDKLSNAPGVFETGTEPAGLMYRVYSAARRSAVKGCAFLPFIKIQTLIPSGAWSYTTELHRVCAAGQLVIDNMVVLYRQMHFGVTIQPILAFVPQDVYNNLDTSYNDELRLSLTQAEARKLLKGKVPQKVQTKIAHLLNVAR